MIKKRRYFPHKKKSATKKPENLRLLQHWNPCLPDNIWTLLLNKARKPHVKRKANLSGIFIPMKKSEHNLHSCIKKKNKLNATTIIFVILKRWKNLLTLNPITPMCVTKTEFLLTISIQYQPDEWWEKRKISIWG